ncbi:hypothetical protein EJB05_47605, partial [Eragrostis curvula]
MAADELIPPCGLPLPDDLLADMLRRLAPRFLAWSRCVCKAWRDIIDSRRLLRADLLPHSLAGILLNLHDDGDDYLFPPFFFRPSSATTAISDNLADLNVSSWLLDHCNGLLLFPDHVLNPATMQRARLPPPPLPDLAAEDLYHGSFLVFDPAVSPHYEVTKHWEQRSFLRQGPPMGTLADVQAQVQASTRLRYNSAYSAYHRGRLYVQWSNDFVTRLDTSGDGSSTYCVVAPPIPGDPTKLPQFHIGTSENGVYCAAFDYHARLQVWHLDESHDQRPEWVLRCDNDMEPLLPCRTCYSEDIEGPWLLRSYYIFGEESFANYDTTVSCSHSDDDEYWSSDIENAPGSQYQVSCYGHTTRKSYYHQCIQAFLGFHPYKEAVFLHDALQRVFAYHFNSSKIQYVGTLILKSHMTIDTSFSYTPCWIAEFPEDN